MRFAGRLSKSADTYAFGVLLWEMFSGQRPWGGMLQMQVGTCMVASTLIVSCTLIVSFYIFVSYFPAGPCKQLMV